MLLFAVYGTALTMVIETHVLRVAGQLSVTACVFSVVGLAGMMIGLAKLSPVPIMAGAFGSIPIAILAIAKGQKGFLTGLKMIVRIVRGLGPNQ